KFNNKVISICVQTEALPGVLAHVDVLISNTNLHLYMADAMKLKCIEVTDATAGTRVTTAGSHTVFAGHSACYNEVNYILNLAYGSALPVESSSMPHKICLDQRNSMGVFYTQGKGPINIAQELTYPVARNYAYEVLGATRNESLMTSLAEQCES